MARRCFGTAPVPKRAYLFQGCKDPIRAQLILCSVVLAITADNVDGPPTLFTTYDTSAGLTGCKIWEVARATSAATTFFKPIRVGRDDVNFIDAAFGYNNPCEVLLEEARRQYPGDRKLRILSIGTGLGDTSSISKTRTSIIKALKKMATSSKKVAMRLENQFGGSGQYYRFNVDRGLQDVTLSDWDKVSEISAHTKNFLSENQKPIQEFVDVFIDTTCEHRAQLQNVTTQARELPSAATIDATNTIPNSSMNSQYYEMKFVHGQQLIRMFIYRSKYRSEVSYTASEKQTLRWT